MDQGSDSAFLRPAPAQDPNQPEPDRWSVDMKIVSVSLAALIVSAGTAMAQAPMQMPGANAGTEVGAGEGRRQQRLQQEGGVDRQERREQRQQERAQRQQPQPDGLEGREQRVEQRQEERAAPRFENRERVDEAVRVDRERAGRMDRRADDRFDERVVVRERDRRPDFRVRVGTDVFVRTLPLQYRTVVVGGRPCRITITRRVRANGRVVITERRNCPGRPQVVIRTR